MTRRAYIAVASEVLAEVLDVDRVTSVRLSPGTGSVHFYVEADDLPDVASGWEAPIVDGPEFESIEVDGERLIRNCGRRR